MDKIKCPWCDQENEIQRVNGFVLDSVEYNCACGFKIYVAEWGYDMAVSMIIKEIEKERNNKDKTF